MLEPKVTLQKKENTKQLLERLKDLDKLAVYVGIPEEKTARRGDKVNNAQLLFIHTNGSPLRRIPARPVIEPAIEAPDHKAEIVGYLKGAIQANLDGDKAQTVKLLDRAGQAGEEAARDWFVDPRNGWAPLKWSTILRKSKKMVEKQLRPSILMFAKEEGFTLQQYQVLSDAMRPLIDTAQMRRAITHVLREAT